MTASGSWATTRRTTGWCRRWPRPATAASRTWSEVEASNRHTCGRDASGAVFCWGLLEGLNDHGTLVWLPTRRFQSIVATDVAGGWFVQCVVSGQQRAWCDGPDSPQVELASSGAVASVVVAGAHTCGVTTAGPMYCWGHGSLGSMGDDRRDQSAAPVDVDGVPTLTQVGPNPYSATCGLDAAGAAWCWPTPFDIPFSAPDRRCHWAGHNNWYLRAPRNRRDAVLGEQPSRMVWRRNVHDREGQSSAGWRRHSLRGGELRHVGRRLRHRRWTGRPTAGAVRPLHHWARPTAQGEIATLPLKLY